MRNLLRKLRSWAKRPLDSMVLEEVEPHIWTFLPQPGIDS